ncbi:TauE superfamily protein [Candidatus Planktophila versatilis]|uniref:Probable membrane transporter protein n=1 Tax=Candidatus Planktophila versatilis TaxID=1884905 RepID=A0ABN5BFH0_9ACTN|nr:TauE superfamily protein [Candidatus Planktophila versatilis]
MSALTLTLILCAGFSAGFIDAIAGGGGLIQLPAMLISFPQKEVIEVVGTSKAGAIWGTSAAALNYRRNIKTDPKLLIAMVLPAFIGSGLGSLLATQISTTQLKAGIVVMLVAVFIYTLIHPDLGKIEIFKHSHLRRMQIAISAGFIIGFYDGLIGPGTGTLLMIVLVAGFGFAFVGASAIAKVVNVATNLASILVIGFNASIMWKVGIALGIVNLAGGFLGSHVAINKGSEFVRKFYLVVTFVLIVRVLFDLFK